MLTRYRTDSYGALNKNAHIYTAEEHGIKREKIDRKALQVIHRLTSHGYCAYIVGGAVRDFLLGKEPKDFDIATDASPNDIRKLFRNSRVIGRRFKLVHIVFGKHVLEVSTFRSDIDEENTYGTIEEDVKRRDFTLNALYYDPHKEYVLDYIDGYKDIIEKKIRPIIPLNKIFVEDPVRMVRAVKYSVMTGFDLTKKVKRAIKKHSALIKSCPASRITEEIFKIMQSGYSAEIFKNMDEMELTKNILPNLYYSLENEKLSRFGETMKERFLADLAYLDGKIRNKKHFDRFETIQMLVQEVITNKIESQKEYSIDYHELFRLTKHLLTPMTPPNLEVEQAVKRIMRYYIP